MNGVVYYFLQVITCSAILYIFYLVALRNRAFHYWNRFYLIIAVFLSVLLPVIKIDIPQENNIPVFEAAVPIVKAVQAGDIYIDTFSKPDKQQNATNIFTTIFTVGYLLVSLIITAAFFLALFKIMKITRRYEKVSINGIHFLSTSEPGTPFSFLKYIFWNKEISLNSDIGKQILFHEIVHVRQKHTYDKIFIECIMMIYWINPFFWIIRRELSMIHEFIADKESVTDQDSSVFAAMLLKVAFPRHTFSVGNYFFRSEIKRRLKMLMVNKSAGWTYINRLLSLPVFLFVFICFGLKVSEANPNLNKFLREQINITGSYYHDLVKPDASPAITKKTNKQNNYSSSKPNHLQVQKYPTVKSDSIPNNIISAEYRGTGEVIIRYNDGSKIVLQENDALVKGYIPLEILKSRIADLRFGHSSIKYIVPKNPIIYINGVEYPGTTEIAKLEELVQPGGIALIQISEGEKAIQEYSSKGSDGVIWINKKGSPDRFNLYSKNASAGLKVLDNPDFVISDVSLEGPLVYKADIDPGFKGGVQALQDYITDHLNSTTVTTTGGLAGECSIRFMVNNYGFIYGFKIISIPEKTNDVLAKEIVGILHRGPRWEPGVWQGEKVNTYYTLAYKYPTSIK